MAFLNWIQENLDFFVLLTFMIGSTFLLVYWHLDKSNRFDLRDLFIDSQTKLLSLYKIGQVIALIVSTWIVLHETRLNRLSEVFFLGYISVWSGINILNNYMGKQYSNGNMNRDNDDSVITQQTTTTNRKRVFNPPNT